MLRGHIEVAPRRARMHPGRRAHAESLACVMASAIILGFTLPVSATQEGESEPEKSVRSVETVCPDSSVLMVGFLTTTSGSAHHSPTEDANAKALTNYFRLVAARSGDDTARHNLPCPVSFNIVRGNYYELMSWLRSGQLDAAVVSPFMADILLRQPGDSYRRLAEFAEASPEFIAPLTSDPETRKALVRGHLPLLRTNSTLHSNDPVQDYDNYLCALLQDPGDSGEQPKVSIASLCQTPVPGEVGHSPKDYELHYVSHLSSTGFLAPTLHAKAWLTGRLAKVPDAERAAVEDLFWERYLAHLSFTLGNGSGEEIRRSQRIRLDFGYSGQKVTGKDEQTTAFRAYSIDDGPPPTGPKGTLIPNDVLVAARNRRTKELGLFDSEFSWLVDDGDEKWDHAGSSFDHVIKPNGNQEVWDRSSELTGNLFGTHLNGACQQYCTMQETYLSWYQQGNYAFTIDEIVTLAGQDQELSGVKDLSLVLPGGGVKSVYQSALIDYLYFGRRGTGDDVPVSVANEFADEAAPLKVRHIVGTSGGAMTGLFTSQLNSWNDGLIEDIWIKNGTPTMRDTDLFPTFSLLRYFALVVVLILLGPSLVLWSAFLRPPNPPSPTPATSDAGPAPFPRPDRLATVRSGAFFVIALLTPSLVAAGSLAAQRRQLYSPVVEALTGLLVALYLHQCWEAQARAAAGIETGAPGETHILTPRASLWIFIAGFLAMVAGIAGAHRKEIVRSLVIIHQHIWWPSALAVAGATLCVVAATPLGVTGGISRAALIRAGRGWSFLLAVLLTSIALFLLGRALGFWSLIEVTAHFWLGVVVCGFLGIVSMLVLFVRRGWRDRVAYWTSNRDILPVVLIRLIAMLVVSVGGWLALVPGAIYNASSSFSFLERKWEERVKEGEPQFKTDFIVTATNLDQDRNDLPADLYSCFPASKGIQPSCIPRQEDPRWNVRHDAGPSASDVLLDYVFASGSPFPVFPAHAVPIGQGFGAQRHVLLVDGGYAHNIPVEAAWLAGARQVLILDSAPEDIPDRCDTSDGSVNRPSWPSALFRNMSVLGPFLFDHSQSADGVAQRSMFVASIAPSALSPDERCRGPFPFLADFDAPTVRLLAEYAGQDLAPGRRPGRVTSWGEPLEWRVAQGPSGGKRVEPH